MMAAYRSRHSRDQQEDMPPVPHGRGHLFAEHANNPTWQAWMRNLLNDYVPADVTLHGMWHGRLRNPGGFNPNDGPFEATLLDFAPPHVTRPHVSHDNQNRHVGYDGYRAGGSSGLDTVSSGEGVKTTGKVAAFLARSTVGGSLQYGFREYLQDIGPAEVQNGVGYMAYIAQPTGDSTYSTYSALSIPNRNLEDGTRGRPGVSSTFWTTGELDVDELAGLAARDYPAEVAQARADSPYGEIAIGGLAVVILT